MIHVNYLKLWEYAHEILRRIDALLATIENADTASFSFADVCESAWQLDSLLNQPIYGKICSWWEDTPHNTGSLVGNLPEVARCIGSLVIKLAEPSVARASQSFWADWGDRFRQERAGIEESIECLEAFSPLAEHLEQIARERLQDPSYVAMLQDEAGNPDTGIDPVNDMLSQVVIESADDFSEVDLAVTDASRAEQSAEGEDPHILESNAQSHSDDGELPQRSRAQQPTEPAEDNRNDIAVFKGVTLRDAAEIIRSDDTREATRLTRTWRNSKNPKLPPSIGKCPKCRQSNLFKPDELMVFLKEIEGKRVDQTYRLSAYLRKVSREPRPESVQ